MATYPQGITSFIPSYQPFQLDWNVLSRNLQLKQTKYDQNWSQLNNVYSRLYETQVSNPESQKVKDSILKQIDFDVRRVAGMDLSLKQNVIQAEQVFKPFYQNPNLIADIVKTNQFNTEYAKGKSFATSKNKQEQGMYWGGGLQYLNNKMEEFKALPFDQLSSFETFNYVPYVNTDKVMREIQKEMGNVKVMQRNGAYWVTTQNGELLKEPLQRRFRQALASDPRVMDVYRVEAYNAGQADIKDKMSKDANLSRQDAERLYLNEQVRDAQQKQLDKIKSEKKIVQNKVDNLRIKSEKNPTEDVDNSLAQYEKYLSDLEQMEESMTETLETLTGNVKSTGNTEGGTPFNPEDLKNLRYGIDLNLASQMLEGDILRTASNMSIANFEQTYKVDELAKINYSKRKELENYQKKKFIDGMAKTGRYPYLFRDKNGEPTHFPTLDENAREAANKAKIAYDKEIKKKLETGEYEIGPQGLPVPTQSKHFVQLEPVKGATPGGMSKDDVERLIYNNVVAAEENMDKTIVSLKNIMSEMLDKGYTTPEEVNNIFGSWGNNRYDQAQFRKYKDMYESGEIDKKTAYAMFRKAIAAPKKGEPDPRLGGSGVNDGSRDFRNQTEEVQAQRTKDMLATDYIMGSKQDFELGLILENYKTFVKENNALFSKSMKEQNNKIYSLTHDLEDYNIIQAKADEANKKRSEEELALLIDYAKKVGGNMHERAHLMNTYDPITGGYRTVSYDEYVRGAVNQYGPQELEPASRLTTSGAVQNFMKGFTVAAVTGSALEAANVIPGMGFAAHLIWSIAGGATAMITGAVADEAMDAYDEYVAEDPEWFIEGMNTNKDLGFLESMGTVSSRGNNLRAEYDNYLEEINRIYEDQDLKTPIPGTRSFVDQQALSAGTADMTLGTPTINVDSKMPNLPPMQQYLSELKPILKTIEVKAEMDDEDLNNVSVYGLSESDYETSTDDFDGKTLSDLANLMLTDLSKFPSKDEDYNLKNFKIGVSPISKNSSTSGAVILWPNESFIDKKLKTLFPDSDDKDKREKLKVEMLKKEQGFAINVPVDLIKNTTLYKAQTMDMPMQAIIANGGERMYESSEPGYAISFKSVTGDPNGVLQVTEYAPVYSIVTNKNEIVQTTVPELVMGRNVGKARDYYLNVKVPQLIYQNNARYQQAKSQLQKIK